MLPQSGVAMTNFDGNGNLSQVDFVTVNGVPAPGHTNGNGFRDQETGTYTVNSDCTGSAEIDFPPPPHQKVGQVVKLKFVLANSGNEIRNVVSELHVPPSKMCHKPKGCDFPAAIRADGVKVQ